MVTALMACGDVMGIEIVRMGQMKMDVVSGVCNEVNVIYW